MSINAFISNFNGGYRPNRFKVSIMGIDDKLEFLCRSATIPSSEINTIDVSYMGLSIPVVGDRPGGRTWEIEVFLDTDFKIRNQFEAWQEIIRPQELPGGVDIVGSIRTATVDLLGTNGETLRTYNILRCWPTSLGEIALGHDNSDQIGTFTVSLAITNWTAIANIL